jgi:hypothetical protein
MSYAAPIIAKGGDPFDQFLQITGFLGSVDLDAMTPEERAVALIDRMNGQIANGGFDQYFGNDGLNYPRECVISLRQLGMPKRADLVERALAALPRAIYDYEDFCNPELNATLKNLTKEFYALDEVEDIYEKTMQFVASNVDKFGYQP